ncbi:unnamed protein product [Euphydryas editha]|uniref:PX domain-containing protein kinase-like protein n=1 Tax=Euphydryas editha TaxID=104508 RepID=A0AAU9TP34_EUPED|nr:unnamed protein product [Euphydryas editha]
MAIFEKSLQTKIQIDDTERLECVLENSQNINNHTEYILRVQRGQNKENRWTVSRRYRDFAALHVSLQQANINLPIPPKKFIGNMQPSFVAERQTALQNYINEVLKHQVLSLSLQVRSFLDPSNYLSISDYNGIYVLLKKLVIGFNMLLEQALQTISIALRGDGQFELKSALPDIGWRIRKHYFLVNELESQMNCLLSWQSYGPDCILHSKDLQIAFKSLQNISHPYIDKILSIHTLETGAYIVRNIHENGSIRDLLYGTEYNKNYLAKYGNPKVRKPFTNGQISHYGYQILQALKFLHEKGLCHGHLHPGNITIENQRVLLLDIENFLMGVPSLYRPFLLELKRTSNAEAIDVYCFGQTLYEMSFGMPLKTYYCDVYPDGIPHDLESVLRLCLSSTASKHSGPTLEQLLQHPFFTHSSPNGLTPTCDTRAHLKFPLNIKDQLKTAVNVMEERLRIGQKMVRNAKKEVRIQEILNSEEEMKKQKRRVKRRESVWKSNSSLADVSMASSPSPPSPPTPPVPAAPAAPALAAPVALSSADTSRGALLSAICSFDKSRLARVASR